MKEAVQFAHFGKNLRGRDFVVGDLHGCFSALDERLKAADFNPEVDRLFSLGDLVDRGPESIKVLDYLAKPWFHAVRGNHEEMFLELYRHGEPDDDLIEETCQANGMEWWIQLEEPLRRRCLDAFAKLPIIAEVQTERGTVGLVHADVPNAMDWPEFRRRICAGDKKTTAYALWSRQRLEWNNTRGVRGIGRIFCGHTIGDTIRNLGNIYYVDCGAFLAPLEGEDRGPTVSLMIAKTSNLRNARFDAPAIVHGSTTDLPFGQYSALQA